MSVNQWWMCDEGRYGYHHIHSEKRLTSPRCREGDEWIDLDWSAVPGELGRRLRQAGRLAAVVSPHLTVEEAYLLASFIRSIDHEAVLALGPIPQEGTDETFPTGFTIHAEKCPNRRGVEEVLSHFGPRVIPFDELIERLNGDSVGGIWISGGYKTDWIDDATAASLANVSLVVVQDLFDSPLAHRATYVLPGAAFAEREGSFVNYQTRLQTFAWAIRPPAGCWPEGRLYWRLLDRPGMYNARRVLEEVAREIAFFAAAIDSIPAIGVDLRVNQLV
jgi:NADH-quinone oxidoreductase subunit G